MRAVRDTFIETAKAIYYTRIYRTAPEDSGLDKLVLVHGLGISGSYMHKLAEELSEKYIVYVPDLPGFGNSSKPAFTMTIQELADALFDWAQAFPVEEAWYVGNSTGCQVIADFSILYKSKVKGIVLQGPVIDPYYRDKTNQILRFFKNSPNEPSSQVLLMLKDYSKCGIERVWRTLEYAIQYKTENFLPQVEVPALVIRGENDLLVSQQWAEEAAGLLPQGKLLILAGEAHTINYSAPQFMAQSITEFISSIIA